MSIANISLGAIDKLLSATSEELPAGSKGAKLFEKFSELLTTGAGADHEGNPEHEKLKDSGSPNALQPGDEIDIVAFLGFVAALEDQVSKTAGGESTRANAPKFFGEEIGSKDLAQPFIADTDLAMMRDKLAQAMSTLADDPQAVAVSKLNGLLPYLEAFHRHSLAGVAKEPRTTDALPMAEGALGLNDAEIMVRTQHTAYPSEAIARQPATNFLPPVDLSNDESRLPKPSPVQLDKLGPPKHGNTPVKLLSRQSGKAVLVSNDAQSFEPINGKSAKPELGRDALAVIGIKENLEQAVATPGPANLVKVTYTAEISPKSVPAQATGTQTDMKPHASLMHQTPPIEPEKVSAPLQRAVDSLSPADLSKDNAPRLPSSPSSPPVDPSADLSKDNAPRLPSSPSSPPVDPSADLSKNNALRLPSSPSSPLGDPLADLETTPKSDSSILQIPKGQQKEAVKRANLLKPEAAFKPEQIALRATSESSNDAAVPSKIKVALEASGPIAGTPLQKAVEAEFKPKPDVKGTTAKIQKPSDQGKAATAPVPRAVASAKQRHESVAAVASEGWADGAKDLAAVPRFISSSNSVNPQLPQTQTAPQTSGQLLDKWVDSHLDLNARGWTQTLARNVISALRTGQQQIALTLSPASLGKMHIAFGRNENGLDVKIQAERKATVSLFGESEGKIISSLETAGYRVTSLSCSVMQTNDENFNMNLKQEFNEQENPSGDERSQTAQKNEQHAEKEADDVSLKAKGDQDGLVDITI
jgi:hypothetical protein